MIKIKTTTNTNISMKSVHLALDNKALIDEDGQIIDIYTLIDNVYGADTDVSISITYKAEEDTE